MANFGIKTGFETNLHEPVTEPDAVFFTLKFEHKLQTTCYAIEWVNFATVATLYAKPEGTEMRLISIFL